MNQRWQHVCGKSAAIRIQGDVPANGEEIVAISNDPDVVFGFREQLETVERTHLWIRAEHERPRGGYDEDISRLETQRRTLADWEWAMRVNFWGVLHGIKSFVPRLLEQEQSGDADVHIVNTSSLAGVSTVAYSGPYVVSKFATAALTESLAHDLRATESAIGVSCLVPGAIATSIAQSTRNRPDEVPSEAQAPDHWSVAQSLDRMVGEHGLTPTHAANIVFDGIRAKQFWICTANESLYQGLMRSRYEAILEHELPPGAQY